MSQVQAPKPEVLKRSAFCELLRTLGTRALANSWGSISLFGGLFCKEGTIGNTLQGTYIVAILGTSISNNYHLGNVGTKKQSELKVDQD